MYKLLNSITNLSSINIKVYIYIHIYCSYGIILLTRIANYINNGLVINGCYWKVGLTL